MTPPALRRQPGSALCFVCGTQNPTGELVRNHRRLMEMRGHLVVADTGERLAEAEGTFVPLSDAARDELARRLGGDFAAWEQWLSSTRAGGSR